MEQDECITKAVIYIMDAGPVKVHVAMLDIKKLARNRKRQRIHREFTIPFRDRLGNSVSHYSMTREDFPISQGQFAFSPRTWVGARPLKSMWFLYITGKYLTSLS